MYVEEKNKHLPEKNPKSWLPCCGDLLLLYVVMKRAVSYRATFYTVPSMLCSKVHLFNESISTHIFFWTDFHCHHFLSTLNYCQVGGGRFEREPIELIIVILWFQWCLWRP